MKVFSKFLGIVFLVATVVILASWSAPSKSLETVIPGIESPRALELQPSFQKTLILNDTSNHCLSCHISYEEVRSRTVDYIYRGEKLQPHEYLDMSKRNPHDTTNAMDCLTCHVQHAEPWPTYDERKGNVNYCINCHHDGEIIHCSECHGNSY